MWLLVRVGQDNAGQRRMLTEGCLLENASPDGCLIISFVVVYKAR
ncbi:hypothetical protein ACFFJN_07585 [Erwinia mallotivora]